MIACIGAVQAVEKLAKSFKARMTVRLAVAGAFHTSYMQPAEEKLRWNTMADTTIIFARSQEIWMIQQYVSSPSLAEAMSCTFGIRIRNR